MATTTHPEILWAQRSSDSDEVKNVIFVTVNLPDIQESTVEYDLTSTTISFKARTGQDSKGIGEKNYAFSFNFFAEVDPELSTKKLTSRSFYIVLRKKEKKEEYWPRLTKEKVKNSFIKTDFSKWVDEDEQDGAEVKIDDDDDMGMGGMGGMPGMGGMGGMPGMGGMGMGGMPGMGGMGGMGGMDLEKMMAQMGGGIPGGDGGISDDEDDHEDGPPPLEEA